MSSFGIPAATAMLAAAASCAGCVGVSLDMPRTAELSHPAPLVAAGAMPTAYKSRWACQSPEGVFPPLGPGDFLSAWGEPASRRTTAGGEIWTYAERGRWCGAWIFAIVPLPLLLPICDTYDEVTFEDGRAVRARSRRFHLTGIGVGFAPQAFFFPVPYRVRAGTTAEANPDMLELFPMVPEARSICTWSPGDASRPVKTSAESSG
ncbi:MAG TPA: hypothetical protein VIS73_00280 [Rhodocyclaceae bacterium]